MIAYSLKSLVAVAALLAAQDEPIAQDTDDQALAVESAQLTLQALRENLKREAAKREEILAQLDELTRVTVETDEEREARIAEQQRQFEQARKDYLSKAPFHLETTSAADVAREWERLDAIEGQSAIIIGDKEALNLILDGSIVAPAAGQAHPDWVTLKTDETLASAATLEFPKDYFALLIEFERQWRTARIQQAADDQEKWARWGIDPDAPVELEKPQQGRWPVFRSLATSLMGDAIPSLGSILANALITHDFDPDFHDYSAFSIPVVPRDGPLYVAVLPTDDWTTAPAYLLNDAWNSYPPADHHVAAFRSFRDRYDAKLIALTFDIVVLKVGRRPTTRAEAMALAAELYQYCPDIIDQGVGTQQALAAELMSSSYWTFWWD